MAATAAEAAVQREFLNGRRKRDLAQRIIIEDLGLTHILSAGVNMQISTVVEIVSLDCMASQSSARPCSPARISQWASICSYLYSSGTPFVPYYKCVKWSCPPPLLRHPSPTRPIICIFVYWFPKEFRLNAFSIPDVQIWMLSTPVCACLRLSAPVCACLRKPPHNPNLSQPIPINSALLSPTQRPPVTIQVNRCTGEP